MFVPVGISPLKLNDARMIQKHKLLTDDAVTLTAAKSLIRQILASSGNRAWLIGSESEKETACAIAALETADANSGRVILRIYPDQSDLVESMIRQVCLKAFLEEDLYRVEVYLPSDRTPSIQVFLSAGFQQEGILRSAIYLSDLKRHQDVVLLSLLRPAYLAGLTAFIPFKIGVFSVTGHEQGLTSADFARYGEPFRSQHIQERAEFAGLLDLEGCLLSQDRILQITGSRGSLVPPDAPQPVQEAAEQVQAYFAGHLTTFDIPLDLSGGSDFQIRVWNELAAIPFGTTWTYEELAHQLTKDDWQAARNMARAVGSACGANPIPLILPCHRVIGKDGRLVGFSGGLDIKEHLLEHELMALLTEQTGGQA